MAEKPKTREEWGEILMATKQEGGVFQTVQAIMDQEHARGLREAADLCDVDRAYQLREAVTFRVHGWAKKAEEFEGKGKVARNLGATMRALAEKGSGDAGT